MGKPIPQVAKELDRRVSELGYELVKIEWAGSRQRPIFRIRVDVVEGDQGVTVADCAKVSRGLEPWLDALEGVPPRYVLEVSSPGVERPLLKKSDWERFRGESVAVKGAKPLAGRATYLEGELVGFDEAPDGEVVTLKLKGGDEVEIPWKEIGNAHLVYRWK